MEGCDTVRTSDGPVWVHREWSQFGCRGMVWLVGGSHKGVKPRRQGRVFSGGSVSGDVRENGWLARERSGKTAGRQGYRAIVGVNGLEELHGSKGVETK